MTNHLAAELRGILYDLHDSEHGDVPKRLVRERLERLAEHVEQATPNPLAASIRHINSTSFEPEDRERYVENLAQRVEHAADQPVEVDASTELTASFGLEPEQQIRAWTAEIVGPPPATNANAMVAWDSAVVTLAAYIRTGERPA